jgi:hypothetical protein
MQTESCRNGRCLAIAGLATWTFVGSVEAAGPFAIAANPEVEVGAVAASDGSQYLVGLMGDGTAPDRIAAQLISAQGALVGPPILTGESGGIPRVAWDGSQFLLAWASGAARPGIHGQFVSQSGARLGSAFTICPSSPREWALGYGAGKYLICWSDGDEVRGQWLRPSGDIDGSSFRVSGGAAKAREHAIAFDGDRFLVVFNGGDDARSKVYGQFVDPQGDLSGNGFLVDDSPEPSDNPMCIVYGGDRYLALFNDEVVVPETASWDILGRLITPTGEVLPERVPIAVEAGAQLLPFAAFDGANFLVAWSDALDTPSAQVRLAFVSPAGQALGASFAGLEASDAGRPVLGAPLYCGGQFLLVGTVGTLTQDFEFATGDVYGWFFPDSTTPPRLEVTGAPKPGEIAFRLTGTPGIDYEIQKLTDWRPDAWTRIETDSNVDGILDFTDRQATGAQRLYRAVR